VPVTPKSESRREGSQHQLDWLVVLQCDHTDAWAAPAERLVELPHQCLHALRVVRAVEDDRRVAGHDVVRLVRSPARGGDESAQSGDHQHDARRRDVQQQAAHDV